MEPKDSCYKCPYLSDTYPWFCNRFEGRLDYLCYEVFDRCQGAGTDIIMWLSNTDYWTEE